MVDGNILTKLTGLIPVVSTYVSAVLGINSMTSNIIVQQLWGLMSTCDLDGVFDMVTCVLTGVLLVSTYLVYRVYCCMTKKKVVPPIPERLMTSVHILNGNTVHRLTQFILKKPAIYGVYPTMTIHYNNTTMPSNTVPMEFVDDEVGVSGHVCTRTSEKEVDGGPETVYIVTTYGIERTAASYVNDITKQNGRWEQLTGEATKKMVYVITRSENLQMTYQQRPMFEISHDSSFDARKADGLRNFAGPQLKETLEYLSRTTLSASSRNHVLYYGEPGNGKSSLVYHIAKIFSRHVVRGSKLSMAVLEGVVNNGVQVQTMRQMVAYPPSELIILMDEMDGVIDDIRESNLVKKEKYTHNSIEATLVTDGHERGIPALLSMLQDGSPAVNGGAWVFATTNHVDTFKSIPALYRRFKPIYVGYLNVDTVREICVMRFGNDVSYKASDFTKVNFNTPNSIIIALAEQSSTYEEFIASLPVVVD